MTTKLTVKFASDEKKREIITGVTSFMNGVVSIISEYSQGYVEVKDTEWIGHLTRGYWYRRNGKLQIWIDPSAGWYIDKWMPSKTRSAESTDELRVSVTPLKFLWALQGNQKCTDFVEEVDWEIVVNVMSRWNIPLKQYVGKGGFEEPMRFFRFSEHIRDDCFMHAFVFIRSKVFADMIDELKVAIPRIEMKVDKLPNSSLSSHFSDRECRFMGKRNACKFCFLGEGKNGYCSIWCRISYKKCFPK